MRANNLNRFGTWQPYHPREVAQLFASATVPWWVAGGWAIDLFLMAQTRDHEDIDVLFLRHDQQEIRALLQGWDVQEAHPELVPGSWPFQEWKQALLLSAHVHDIWCRPKQTGPWAIQLMVIDTQEDQWLFRHHPQIRGSLSTIGGVTHDGIPYLAPEIQLLYKARAMRPKDEADFAHILPALDRQRRQWLAHALTLIHPSSPSLAGSA
jgi:hypothetical protein